MSLFDHGNMKEFLLFIHNFNTTIAATVMLEMGANINYLCTLACGEQLHQFDLLSPEVENTQGLNVDYYIKVYPFISLCEFA